MPDMQVQEIQKSLGETLAEARQQRNLSVQEVSNQLRLDSRFIEALEEENYDALPSPAYTRGYLRSYAKLLSLDADRLISQYNNKAPQAPEIIPDVKHSTQVSSRDTPVKAFSYLVTFILVLLLLAWVQSNFVIREPPLPVSVKPEPRITTPPPQTGPEPHVVPEAVHETAPGAPAETAETTAALPAGSGTTAAQTGAAPDTAGSQTGASGTAAQAAQQAPAQAVSATPAPVAGHATAQAVSATPAPGPGESHETQVSNGTAGPDSINMKLSADSWIEVYDAFNNKLLMTLAHSGDEINLRGTAPFRVKLGYAQGVTLYFDGKYFDPAPYSHGGVARFTLGE